MKINLKTGFDVHIGGEVAKDNSLPLDYFAKICSTFQDFVNEVAKNSLPGETIDLNNFKVELTGFFKGSAVPRFEMTNRIQTVMHGNTEKQKELVSNRIDKLLSLSSTGAYQGISDLYQAPKSRNAIVESMYGFMNSFGTAPIAFGRYNQTKKSFTTAYKAKKFKPSVKETLLLKVIEPTEKRIDEFNTVANVVVTVSDRKITRKVAKAFLTRDVIPAYKPQELLVNNKKYIVSGLLAEFIKEDGYFILKSDLLDIVGSGETEDQAKISFAEEVDYIYSTYTKLPDNRLSDRLIEIKNILLTIVKLSK